VANPGYALLAFAVVGEIEEREAFLKDMAELGRGKEFEGKIRIEINEVRISGTRELAAWSVSFDNDELAPEHVSFCQKTSGVICSCPRDKYCGDRFPVAIAHVLGPQIRQIPGVRKDKLTTGPGRGFGPESITAMLTSQKIPLN
jgi:hypothetical protein